MLSKTSTSYLLGLYKHKDTGNFKCFLRTMLEAEKGSHIIATVPMISRSQNTEVIVVELQFYFVGDNAYSLVNQVEG